MRSRSGVRKVVLALVALAVCTAEGAGGQWAKQPGERVRDHFGPMLGMVATTCRGACGRECPTSCVATVAYECTGSDQLRRVRTYACGTHQGCRVHDDCLDRCRQRQAQGLDCDAQCHAEAIEQFGFQSATSWANGGGPYDGDPITFEYTRDTPEGPEPLFGCPAGATRTCTGSAGRCVTDAGDEAAPVFEAYTGSTATLRVSDFRSGRVCRDGAAASGVCEPAIDIEVTGDARCEQAGTSKPCSWYGFEFDYANADPSAPLLCSSSGAGEDFLGSLVGTALDAMPADQTTEVGEMLGRLQSELQSGRSLQDLLSGVRITPAGEPSLGGETAPAARPGVPSSVALPSASGHLLVPMFEFGDGAAPGSTVVREVRCTHNGSPVLETSFRLNFPAR